MLESCQKALETLQQTFGHSKHWTLKKGVKWDDGQKGRTQRPTRTASRSPGLPHLCSLGPLHLSGDGQEGKRWGSSELIPQWLSEEGEGTGTALERLVPGPVVRREDFYAEIFHIAGRWTRAIFRRNCGFFSSLIVRIKNKYLAQILTGTLTYKVTIWRKERVPPTFLPVAKMSYGSPVTCPHPVYVPWGTWVGSPQDKTVDLTLNICPFQTGRKNHCSTLQNMCPFRNSMDIFPACSGRWFSTLLTEF